MSKNCDAIIIFPIYDQSRAIRKPDSGRIVRKACIFINSIFLSPKKLKIELKISNVALTLLLWVQIVFLPKNTDFLQKNADINKI